VLVTTQRHLEWLVFLAGLATPAIMALVVTPDAPTMLPLTPAHVGTVRGPRKLSGCRPPWPLALTPSPAHTGHQPLPGGVTPHC
jgi:hypothetical protein